MTSATSGLSDLMVLDLSTTPGAGFAASLLADFNATVIVAEPIDGTPLRSVGPADWWQVAARGKLSVAIDSDTDASGDAVAAIATHADVVVTDLAPADQAGNPWLAAARRRERPPVVLELLPTGADHPDLWPWSIRPEFTAATSGMMALTGVADAAPVHPEMPLAEYIAAALAVTRTVAELRRARTAGGGDARDVRVLLHQAVQRMIEWQMPVSTALGRPELRVGNAFPMAAGVANMFRTRDGRYLAVSAANEASARKLLKMIGGSALSDNPEFMSVEGRGRSIESIYGLLETWMAERDADMALADGIAHDVVLGPIYDTDAIAADAQIVARGGIVTLETAEGGNVQVPGIVPRISTIPTGLSRPGPAIGQDSREVLLRCGLTEEAIAVLFDAGAVR